MQKLTEAQRKTLTDLANAISDRGFFFNGDPSKMYAPSVGLNGSALRSLMAAGLVEKLNHRIYKSYYCLTEKGQAV